MECEYENNAIEEDAIINHNNTNETLSSI